MKRRKRKIRIPAAKYGLNGSTLAIPEYTLTTPEQQTMNYMQSLLNNSYQTPLQQYINSNGLLSKPLEDFQAQANINNQVNANRLATISPLNTPINGIGGADSSVDNIAKGVSAAGDLITGGINAVQNSQHETKGQSAASALGSAASMASAGAALGSVIPGVGTAIGAGVGAVAGVITSGLTKGEKAKMTSFTDYDPGKQAGFLRPGRRREINESREHVKKNAYDNRSAVRGTANLLADYNLKYGDMNTNTFAYGGMPSSLAYVDDGELISTPDGSITKIPEEGKPTDSNLVDLPVGSRILSDKLKVPGTKKTFAQLGEEMMATKKSKFNDIYAQNAAKLNEMNNKSIHDQLFEIQERVKAKRNIKPKSKGLPTYADGGNNKPYNRKAFAHTSNELRKLGAAVKDDFGFTGYSGGTGGGAGAGIKFEYLEPQYTDTVVKDTLYIPFVENFNQAFDRARKANLDRFIFDGKEYTTEIGNNPNNNAVGASRTSVGVLPVEIERTERKLKNKEVHAYEYGGEDDNTLLSILNRMGQKSIQRGIKRADALTIPLPNTIGFSLPQFPKPVDTTDYISQIGEDINNQQMLRARDRMRNRTPLISERNGIIYSRDRDEEGNLSDYIDAVLNDVVITPTSKTQITPRTGITTVQADNTRASNPATKTTTSQATASGSVSKKDIPRTTKSTANKVSTLASSVVNPWAYEDDFKYLKNGVYDKDYLNFINNDLTQDMIDLALKEVPNTFSRFRSSNPNYHPTVADARKWATDFKPSDFHRFAQYVYENRNRLGIPESVDLPELTMAGLPNIKGKGVNAPTPSKVKVQPIKTKPVKNQNSRSINVPDLEQIGSGIASLVPIISNLNAKPEYQDPNYNPYADAILNTMRNRRYNINPALRDIQRNRAIANYDASQMNTNTGANLAFRLQNAVNTNRAIADARAYESNVNNQYLGDYANMLNNLGQHWAAETTRVDDANMANRAAARNIRRAGLSGLSQWAQSRELMRNQRERDNAMFELYRDFLSRGFTDSTISNWSRYIRRGGNR